MAALEQAILTWVHLVAASVWVGGSLFIGVVLSPLLRTMTDSVEERMRIMILVGRRFNWAAAPSLAVLVATGVYGSHQLLARPDLMAQTSYGTLLGVKAALVVALVAAYAVHVRVIRRGVEARIMSGEMPPDELRGLRRRIIVLGEVTVVLSVAVLLLAALLDAGV